MKNNIQHISFKVPHNVHFDLYIPDGFTELPLVIAAHGYGQNKELMMELLRDKLEKPCAVASIQAPYPHILPPVLPGRPIKYGFGWITSFEPEAAILVHSTMIKQVLNALRKEKRLAVSQTILLGFSQSVALNFRYALSHPGHIDMIVAICGGIPGDLETNVAYKVSTGSLLILGCTKDMIYPPRTIRRNAEKLKAFFGSVQTHFFECKHEIPQTAFDQINPFLA